MVRAFIEQLNSVGPHRALGLRQVGIVTDAYVYVHPRNPAADQNFDQWESFRAISGLPLWAWIVCSADQAADVVALAEIVRELHPDGIVLNIEKALEDADLTKIATGAAAFGLPGVASLAGANPNHHLYDHRSLDRHGIVTEWQAYSSSGEGPIPAVAVRELYTPTRVLEGAEYRAQTWGKYGWGKVWSWGQYSSYAKKVSYAFGVSRLPSGWPEMNVVDRSLLRHSAQHPAGEKVGALLGLAAYKNIRVALNTTKHEPYSLAEWEALAASARVPGAAKRGCSVYLLDNTPDAVLWAVAKGAS